MQWHNETKDNKENIKEHKDYSKEEFIEKVVKKVHFFPDRYDIRLELADHIEDSKAEIMGGAGSTGRAQAKLSPEEVEREALARMGDPDQIGKKLNRQHNPLIGYLWYFSRIGLVLLTVIIGFQFLAFTAFTGFDILFVHPVKNIPKDQYLRSIKPNEKIVVDDRHIKITHMIQTKDGTLHICYNSYNLSLSSLTGWGSGGLLGTIKDEDGNYYYSGGGSSSGSFYKKGRWGVKNFPLDTNKAILEYDVPDRYFKIEFDLGEVAY